MRRTGWIGVVVIGGLAVGIWRHPPLQRIEPGEVGIRSSALSGAREVFEAGPSGGLLFVMPGVHGLRKFSTRDQVYRPETMSQAGGPAPLHSIEGLSLGVDLSIR